MSMISFSGEQLEEITGGALKGCDLQRVFPVPGFFVDSRAPIPDGVFVALAGERADGHSFLGGVQSAGAALAIISKDSKVPIPAGLPTLSVNDPLAALGQIAHWVRRNVLTAQVIGVTGSSGKTSTKDLIAGILSQFGRCVSPPGSFNTEVGLPLTILSADTDTEFLVLEMGMRGIGHISALAEIAEPDIGLVLNVGSAHIELLGSVENIARAKGELVRGLPESGVAILNLDDPHVRKMSVDISCDEWTFGETSGADFHASDILIETDGTTRFTVTHAGVTCNAHVNLIGLHYVSNALAAISACVAAGVPFETACQLLENVHTISKWRMEVTDTPSGITVINDSYNANPESMRAALKTLAQLGSKAPRRRTWAVLGEMLELGDYSLDAHDSIGRLAVRLDISRLICIGAGTKVMHLAAANEGSWGKESLWVAEPDEAIAILSDELAQGDIVLVKASRSVGLDRVASEIPGLRLSSVKSDFEFDTDAEQGAP